MDKKWFLLLLLISLFLGNAGCKHFSVAFQQSKWIEARKTKSWLVRKEMADDLIKRKLILVKSEKKVKKFLGKPEDCSDIPKDELYYLITEDYGYDIDPVKIEYLVVHMGSNKLVNKAFIKRML